MTFGRPSPEQIRARRAAEKEANLRALGAGPRSLHRGTYTGSTTGPVPKTEPYRDPALLEMARGRPCLLLVPGLCSHRTDTTVACHGNLSIHGKAGARKADDCYSVWGCVACHSWLDQGSADAVLKETTFMRAHLDQVLAWRQVAVDPGEPERFRKASRRAVERLSATQLSTPENATGPAT